MSKIKVMVIPSDFQGGVGFYRAIQPHKYLVDKYGEEFDIKLDSSPTWTDLSRYKDYDIVFCQKKIYDDTRKFVDGVRALKGTHTKIVMDIDDSWNLSPTHPLWNTYQKYNLEQIIKGIIGLADYVTTTTDIFAEEIKPINPNPFVIPNAIDPNDKRFKIKKPKCDKIRFGFVMGSAHEYDVKEMGNFVAQLPQDIIDKIQIVLCGFDLRGHITYTDPVTHVEKKRVITPKESVWYRYENMVTNGRKIISPKYNRFLNMYVPDLEYPDVNNEHYRRCWTKDMSHYYSHFNNIDVLYAPLETKHYNYVKSQLKAIECCFSNTALIASNYGPYTLDLKHAVDEKGKYIEGGNALLVDTDKNNTDWAKFTEMLVKDKKLLKKLQTSIHDTLCEKYNLDTVTDIRANFYKSIVEK